jgi:hypothetical protein
MILLISASCVARITDLSTGRHLVPLVLFPYLRVLRIKILRHGIVPLLSYQQYPFDQPDQVVFVGFLYYIGFFFFFKFLVSCTET